MYTSFPRWHSGIETACQCRGHGFNPWSGKTDVLQSNKAHIPQVLSLSAAATEARTPRARALSKSLQREARAPQPRGAPTHGNWRKPPCSTRDPARAKIHSEKYTNYLYKTARPSVPGGGRCTDGGSHHSLFKLRALNHAC